MNPFADSLADLNAATFGEFADSAAVFYPAGGGSVPCSAMIDRGMAEESLDRVTLGVPKATARLLVSEIAQPRKGDELEADGYRWKLAGAPILDRLGDRWVAPIDELAAL